ncbi:FKBP-type peptidyl-prolyl cis-trans isomerase [Saccharicrinis sp. FJH2]|uniref:FKBP-type peptidyl-prolyl cis-trans isomerase n=1 Tax=Saccharicrinis sp. FJH65 TaxID=3344659 RepID=UPI0035F359AB
MKLNYLLIVLATLLFASCDKDHSRMDDKEIQDYLDSHNITNAKEDASGIYYVIHEEGEGMHPYYYTTVQIMYKGYLTNDEVFDDTHVDEIWETRVDNFIKGFQIGLQKMRPGGKATIFVPSHLAYGSDASFSNSEDLADIPKWAVLIFDIDLVGFKQ